MEMCSLVVNITLQRDTRILLLVRKEGSGRLTVGLFGRASGGGGRYNNIVDSWKREHRK